MKKSKVMVFRKEVAWSQCSVGGECWADGDLQRSGRDKGVARRKAHIKTWSYVSFLAADKCTEYKKTRNIKVLTLLSVCGSVCEPEVSYRVEVLGWNEAWQVINKTHDKFTRNYGDGELCSTRVCENWSWWRGQQTPGFRADSTVQCWWWSLYVPVDRE